MVLNSSTHNDNNKQLVQKKCEPVQVFDHSIGELKIDNKDNLRDSNWKIICNLSTLPNFEISEILENAKLFKKWWFHKDTIYALGFDMGGEKQIYSYTKWDNWYTQTTHCTLTNELDYSPRLLFMWCTKDGSLVFSDYNYTEENIKETNSIPIKVGIVKDWSIKRTIFDENLSNWKLEGTILRDTWNNWEKVIAIKGFNDNGVRHIISIDKKNTVTAEPNYTVPFFRDDNSNLTFKNKGFKTISGINYNMHVVAESLIPFILTEENTQLIKPKYFVKSPDGGSAYGVWNAVTETQRKDDYYLVAYKKNTSWEKEYREQVEWERKTVIYKWWTTSICADTNGDVWYLDLTEDNIAFGKVGSDETTYLDLPNQNKFTSRKYRLAQVTIEVDGKPTICIENETGSEQISFSLTEKKDAVTTTTKIQVLTAENLALVKEKEELTQEVKWLQETYQWLQLNEAKKNLRIDDLTKDNEALHEKVTATEAKFAILLSAIQELVNNAKQNKTWFWGDTWTHTVNLKDLKEQIKQLTLLPTPSSQE